ncbi:MAG TPA: transporter substrate-binding domain-containing protein [Microbacteriaceae bacterium]|nr:transporter substrate-binding domain-containing protein [Microbacteriaceae bacterium]
MEHLERTRRGRVWTRALGGLALATAAALLVTSCASGSPSGESPGPEGSEATAGFDLIGGDKLSVIAPAGAMPAIGTEGDELVGFEAPVFLEVAKRLGLDYDMTWADFPGGLAAIQADRNDVMIGSIAWRASRAESGLFTDPLYYVPTIFAQKRGAGIKTIEDLVGKRVGTASGYYFIDVVQTMPEVDLRIFPDVATTIAELGAGRIDVALLDSTIMVYTAKVRPDLDIEAVKAEGPTEAQLREHPEWEIFGPIMAEWYFPKGHEALVEAFNTTIREMYADGTLVEALKQYGFEDPSEWLTLDPYWHDRLQQERRDADRPADWTLPTL